MKSSISLTFCFLAILTATTPAAPPRITASSGNAKVSLVPNGSGDVSATVDDPTDPSSFPGQFIFSVSDPDGSSGNLTGFVTNSNPAVASVSPVSESSPGVFSFSIAALEKGTATIRFVANNPVSGSASYLLNYAASDASSTPGVSRYHSGASDGSTAIAVTNGAMLVASGEDGFLRLFDMDYSGLPVATTAPPTIFSSGIEASFRVGNRLYWLGSGGAAFSTDLIGNTPVHVNQYASLGADLIQWDSLRGAELGLAENSLRIEGATLAADGTTVLLGLRAPLQNPGGRAVVVRAHNLAAAVDSGGYGVSFGAPVFLDLEGRSIRSMDSTASGQILILAGPVGSRVPSEAAKTFKFFLWDGQSSSPVPLVNEIDSIAADSGGEPECVFDLPAVLENGSSVRVLIDNGNTDHYGTGVSSSLTGNLKKFRSDIVNIYGLPIPPIIVTTTVDSGPGSLRQTIADAPNNSRIVFASPLSGQSIILTSGEIAVALNLRIDGSALPAGITISGNRASRIFNIISGRSLSLFSLTLAEGSATNGGAIYSEGNLTLENCTLTGNNAQNGGAIFANNASGLKTKVINTTLTENRATIAGGAIYNDFGLSELIHCTLTRNSGPPGKGAGIASFGLADTQTHLMNSILSENLTSNADLVGGSFDSFQKSGVNLIGTNASPIHPRLAPLGNYGGSTRTMPPLPDSPAVNAATGSLTIMEQRGSTRDARPDIGATEFRGGADLALFWKLDFDGDGFPFGTEYALGTNPLVADSSSVRNPRVSAPSATSREIGFGGGLSSTPPGIRWVLRRSLNLADFQEILFTFDSSTQLQFIHQPHISVTDSSTSFQLLDRTPDQPKAFYRFEAELIDP